MPKPLSTKSVAAHYNNLPDVVTHLMDRKPLKWRKITGALKSATLDAQKNQYEVSLQKIVAGGKVPKHDHRELEMTVVLQGSFSDEQGLYQAGDFIVREPGQAHQPVSSCHEDCLCLSVQQAPVKLTSWLGRIINPFLRLQTAS